MEQLCSFGYFLKESYPNFLEWKKNYMVLKKDFVVECHCISIFAKPSFKTLQIITFLQPVIFLFETFWIFIKFLSSCCGLDITCL